MIYERAMHARDPHGILKKIFKLYLERGGKFIQTNIKNLEQLYEYTKGKLNIVGLMCIPPINEDSKKHFETLRELADKLNIRELSMGMSHDYLKAGLTGATYVRIRSKIFGQRD